MILHRLASAIRHQNWSQIITEILIVVIGIFLGLQVTDWYEGKQAEQEEVRIVAAMLLDVEQTIDSLDGTNEFHSLVLEKSYVVLEALENGDLPADKVADFEQGLFLAGRTGSVVGHLNSFHDENLSKIIDPMLRSVLDEYVGALNRETDTIGRITSRLVTLMPQMSAKSVVSEPYDEEGDRRIIVYDFESLKNDLQYRSVFGAVFSRIIDVRRRANDLRDNTLLLRDALLRHQSGKTITNVDFQ